MNKIRINATRHTPEVSFDRDLGNLGFTGKSFPENPKSFYNGIQILVDQLKFCKSKSISFYMNIDLFNAGTASCLYSIFKNIAELELLGKHLDLNWYYEADDQNMLEIGQDFADSLNLRFNFVPCLKSDTVMDNFVRI